VSGPLQVFLHVPKAAGSALEFALRHQLGNRAALLRLQNPDAHKRRTLHTARVLADGNDWFVTPETLATLPARVAATARVDMVSGHFGYGVGDLLGEPVRTFTVLRRPVERVLSQYRYLRARYPAARDLSLADYVDGNAAIDNVQTRVLAGHAGRIAGVPFGGCDAALLDLARRRLDGDVLAGLAERFAETLVVLRRHLGWGFPLTYRRNASPGPHPPPSSPAGIDAGVLRAIERANELDAALYAYAESRFDAAFSALPEACRTREVAQVRCVVERGGGLLQRVDAFERGRAASPPRRAGDWLALLLRAARSSRDEAVW
jgi:hypothetical protein